MHNVLTFFFRNTYSGGKEKEVVYMGNYNNCGCGNNGMDDSLLFFFLLLIFIFCRPGIVGCGNDCDSCC